MQEAVAIFMVMSIVIILFSYYQSSARHTYTIDYNALTTSRSRLGPRDMYNIVCVKNYMN